MASTATVIVTLVSSVVGSSALASFVQWLLGRLDKRNGLEKAIADSPTIKSIELELYRQTLFAKPKSRAEHEHQLDVGDAYLKLGGNGAGHARLDQLKADYQRRLTADDWAY